MARGDRASRTARPAGPAVAAAFDTLRFGRENTLDLRSSLPTGAEAARQAELFLRERQVASANEVLVITGRGNQSTDGVPVVRPAVVGVLTRLRRQGVVTRWNEHTAGSFAVTPAPITALLEVPRRRRYPVKPAVADPAGLADLDPATRQTLRALAIRSLQALGAPVRESFVHDEMQRQFSVLGASIPDGPDREARLRVAAETALDELDDAE
ncbi:MAG: hypothetical protein C0497_14635 [Gemmatimonas sp.]|nr:hypothetical protein [Gemmatimonas sp.]